MHRALPKIVVLLAIGAVLAVIFMVERRNTAPDPGLVYVNPGFSTPAPAPPAP